MFDWDDEKVKVKKININFLCLIEKKNEKIEKIFVLMYHHKNKFFISVSQKKKKIVII
jgi:hypothetical protein